MNHFHGGCSVSVSVARRLAAGDPVKSVADELPEPTRSYLLSGEWAVTSIDVASGYIQLSRKM